MLIGPHSGQYVWLNGPMTLSDMIIFQMKIIWLIGKKIRSYISSEEVKMAKLNWEASYTPTSWGSPKYLSGEHLKSNKTWIVMEKF